MTVVDVRGVLDGTTYRAVRDAVVKAAIDEPAAVIVDVSSLVVPAPSAWVVFVSAHWQVGAWRMVPIVVVSTDASHRHEMQRAGLPRYLAVHPTIEAALAATAPPHQHRSPRHRARLELPPIPASVRLAQRFTADRLAAWSRTEFALTAHVVTAVLVDNALGHGGGSPVLRVEAGTDTVTVAVADTSTVPAAIGDDSQSRGGLSGLQIMSAFCRTWGNAAHDRGKTVWAVIGPENQLHGR